MTNEQPDEWELPSLDEETEEELEEEKKPIKKPLLPSLKKKKDPIEEIIEIAEVINNLLEKSKEREEMTQKIAENIILSNLDVNQSVTFCESLKLRILLEGQNEEGKED